MFPPFFVSLCFCSQNVKDYTKYMLMHFWSFDDLKGEELWIEFTCNFRKESIIALTSTVQLDWARFLRSREVHVTMRRGTKRARAFSDFLQTEHFISSDQPAENIPVAENTSQQPIISDTTTDHAPIVAFRLDQNIVKEGDNKKSKATLANSSSSRRSFPLDKHLYNPWWNLTVTNRNIQGLLWKILKVVWSNKIRIVNCLN